VAPLRVQGARRGQRHREDGGRAGRSESGVGHALRYGTARCADAARARRLRCDAASARAAAPYLSFSPEIRMRLPRMLAVPALAAVAWLATGCERAVFAVANRGLPPPESSVAYAPELGLSLDIYRPQRSDPRAAPVVVFFYGGAWQRGTREQYRFVGRRLAQNGVLAVVADYRTWPRAGFPAFVDDAARAVAWAHRNAAAHGGDPRRLFVAGHSAGAQIAALVGADGRYLRAHGLEPRDLAGVVGLSGPYDFAITGQYVPIFGDPAQWPRAQAVNAVGGDEPPFLLVHGEADRVVEAYDSRLMAERLRARGVDARLLMLPGAAHTAPLQGLYDPRREPAVLPAILAFVGAG
jgi:acetyl esterase/lipase